MKKSNNIYIDAFKISIDINDKWGSTMDWCFSLCEFLEDNTYGCLDEWRFTQSIMGSDRNLHVYKLINSMCDLSKDDCISQLQYFERVLMRYMESIREEHSY